MAAELVLKRTDFTFQRCFALGHVAGCEFGLDAVQLLTQLGLNFTKALQPLREQLVALVLKRHLPADSLKLALSLIQGPNPVSHAVHDEST